MKNRLTELFQKKKDHVLSVFYTAGYPEKQAAIDVAIALEKAGADVIEIGIPFSDPIADGPTIQASNKIALENGMTLTVLLEQVKELRAHVTLPVVLMGYLNPVMQFGTERFFKAAAQAGVDGIILPDLPLEEFERDYKALTDSLNLSVSFLVAPSTSETRIRKADALSSGFIYAVSSSSTTGAKDSFAEEQLAYFKKLSEMNLSNPFLIGFGISNSKTYRQATEFAAGAIVGSSFITCLSQSKEREKDIPAFVRSIRG